MGVPVATDKTGTVGFTIGDRTELCLTLLAFTFSLTRRMIAR